jgi:outer membrane protein OmpA-like peptidoglycan-associated protein
MRWTISLVASLLALSTVSAGPARGVSCFTGPYIVFFGPGIAYLDVEAREILDHASKGAASCGYGRTLLAGHTDTNEEASLAQKRVDVVRAYLAAHGIPNEDITGMALGTTQPRVRTDPNVSERQNRRVEIVVSWRG